MIKLDISTMPLGMVELLTKEATKKLAVLACDNFAATGVGDWSRQERNLEEMLSHIGFLSSAYKRLGDAVGLRMIASMKDIVEADLKKLREVRDLTKAVGAINTIGIGQA